MLINSHQSGKVSDKELLSGMGVRHHAEIVAYAVLLLTLAILPLALALSGPSKDPLFVASASSITFFLLVGLVTFLIGTGRAVLRRDD